jgi:hypothetical protein
LKLKKVKFKWIITKRIFTPKFIQIPNKRLRKRRREIRRSKYKSNNLILQLLLLMFGKIKIKIVRGNLNTSATKTPALITVNLKWKAAATCSHPTTTKQDHEVFPTTLKRTIFSATLKRKKRKKNK